MRALAVVGVLVALAAVAGFVVAGDGTAEYESTAKIAFIEDTQFDYVDAERDRLIGLVDVDAVLDRPGVLAIDFIRPDTVTFFDITVTASTPQAAADTANAVADTIVEGDLALRHAPIDAEIAVLTDQLTDIGTEIATLESAIDADIAREAFAEANRFEGDSDQLERLTIELREAQDALFLNQRLRNSLDEYRIQAEQRIAELDAELARTIAETRVVDPASAPTERSDVTAARGALLAALAALGVSGIGLALIVPSRARAQP